MFIGVGGATSCREEDRKAAVLASRGRMDEDGSGSWVLDSACPPMYSSEPSSRKNIVRLHDTQRH